MTCMKRLAQAGMACAIAMSLGAIAEEPAPTTCRIAGVVADTDTSGPVAAALVWLWRDAPAEGAEQEGAKRRDTLAVSSTDGQGRFVFADVSLAEPVNLTVFRPGFTPEERELVLQDGTPELKVEVCLKSLSEDAGSQPDAFDETLWRTGLGLMRQSVIKKQGKAK